MTPTTRESDGAELITASEIAEFAGVTQSAVSNWRKRFTNFPQPEGTAETGGDLFSRDAIEAWLEERPRPARRPSRPRPASSVELAFPVQMGIAPALAAALLTVIPDLEPDLMERFRTRAIGVGEFFREAV